MSTWFSRLGKPLPLALAAGLLLGLACAGPISAAPAAWIGLAPLLQASLASQPRQAARLGFISGLLHYTVMLYWVVIVMSTYGHLPWWLTLPLLLLLAAYMSLYTALFCGLTSWMGRRLPPLLFAPFLWVGLDLLRGRLLTGFPWQDLAYTQYRWPLLIQAADLFGHFGVTYMIVLVNCLLLALLMPWLASKGLAAGRPTPRPLLLVAAGLLIAFLIYDGVRYQRVAASLSNARQLPVAVVQGNIPQDQKWLRGTKEYTVSTYVNLSKQVLARHPASLVIWPETALPLYPLEKDAFPKVMARLKPPPGALLLTGAPHRMPSLASDSIDYYNSAFLMAPANPDPDGPPRLLGRYDKQHLVPFGEYVPLRSLLPLPGPLVESIGDFTAGDSSVPLASEQARLGVLICYESIFPELARKQVANGANLLVNITNDAWFGRSSAPWQHLSMAVLRAVESRRSLARAANTGVSGFIDPLGRLAATTPLFETCYLQQELPLCESTTFHTRYGHLFSTVSLLAAIGCIFFCRRRPVPV